MINYIRSGSVSPYYSTTILIMGALVMYALAEMSNSCQQFYRFVITQQPLRFREVFLRCICCWRIVCLGIYRLADQGFRYVLANPSPNTIIHLSDLVSLAGCPSTW